MRRRPASKLCGSLPGYLRRRWNSLGDMPLIRLNMVDKSDGLLEAELHRDEGHGLIATTKPLVASFTAKRHFALTIGARLDL